MNPVLIYQNEAKFDFNNTFTIEFSNNNVDLFVNLSRKKQYYITSLNCNIKKKNKTKTTFETTEEKVKELSSISRELLSKGATLKNDIDYVKTDLLARFDLPDIAPHNYKLFLNAKIINDNCYSYQFFDTEDKRLKFAKIYSPFTHFKKGFIFKGEKDPNKKNEIRIQLINNSEIIHTFYQNPDKRPYIERNLYRDYNAKIFKNPKTGKIYISDPNLYLFAEKRFLNFGAVNIRDMMYFLFEKKFLRLKKYPVIGTEESNENTALIQYGKRITVYANKEYFTFGAENANHLQTDGTVQQYSTFVGFYNIIDKDKKQIEKLLPNFSFKRLSKFRGNGTTDFRNNDIFYPSAKAAHPTDKTIFDPKTNFMRIYSEKKKYKDYFTSNHGVFFDNVKKKIPHDIKNCEKTFDEEVLKIKKLVEEIGIPKEIPEYEQINLAIYDETNIIEETFVQRLNKKIQLYGIASIPFAHIKKNHIVSLNNLLPFRINEDTKKHKITFSLQNLEGKTPIETTDNKIYNLSILSVEKDKKMSKIEKEITIEALQVFDKYQKLNPIEIQITDGDIFKELTLYKNLKVKYKFVPNSILFSSSVQQETEVIFLAVNGLNEARDVLLNGKKIKVIGCIFTNEIEGWDVIKKITSNWVSCKLSNSKYPIGAKHLGFEFVTSRLNALIDFTLYLLDQEGKEIKFASTEEKTPALNFSIQIIS